MASSVERRDKQQSVVGRRQRSGRLGTMVFAAVVVAGILALIIFLVLPSYRENGTGFQNRTLWDWLAVLVVPAVLAVAAVFYDWREKEARRRTGGE
jgi:Kef-type K+ transport system membrane component KefB